MSAEGIATNPDTVRAVVEFPVPRTLKHVRSFLGLCSYYRKYVKNFSALARPLHALCPLVHAKFPHDKKKGERQALGNLWTEECQEAFISLKHSLTSAPVLGFADYTQDFIVETDASLTGLGAVLSQIQDGQTRVIAYASRTLN